MVLGRFEVEYVCNNACMHSKHLTIYKGLVHNRLATHDKLIFLND
jgi:hypothetical protein